MKKIPLILLLLMVPFISCTASTDKEIKLPAPNMGRSGTVMKSLSERKSTREYTAQELSLAELSDLLWAANGINRPEDKKRTAPSAMNKQDIDIYVIMEKGAYLYDAHKHALLLIAEGDYRQAVAGTQEFVLQAPVSLVLVSDLSRLGDWNSERVRMTGAIDAGIVSQNISVFCAAANLATVPRMSMEHDSIKKVLNLKEAQLPLVNHPVGHFKKIK